MYHIDVVTYGLYYALVLYDLQLIKDIFVKRLSRETRTLASELSSQGLPDLILFREVHVEVDA